MQEDPKTGRLTMSIEELAYYNMFMVEALFELLAEKGILNGVEVKERVKKLQAETKLTRARNHRSYTRHPRWDSNTEKQ